MGYPSDIRRGNSVVPRKSGASTECGVSLLRILF